MTIRQAAQEVIDIQDAVNLAGVLASFHEIVRDVVWPEARRIEQGTRWVNQHPICTLFISKIASLNGYAVDPDAESALAYDACLKLARGDSAGRNTCI